MNPVTRKPSWCHTYISQAPCIRSLLRFLRHSALLPRRLWRVAPVPCPRLHAKVEPLPGSHARPRACEVLLCWCWHRVRVPRMLSACATSLSHKDLPPTGSARARVPLNSSALCITSSHRPCKSPSAQCMRHFVVRCTTALRRHTSVSPSHRALPAITQRSDTTPPHPHLFRCAAPLHN